MKRIFYVGSFGEDDDNIDEKLIARFIDLVNQIDDEQDELVVFIDSGGGVYAHALTISEVLSRLKNVSLVAVKEVSSSALSIFFNTICKEKKVLPTAFGYWHKGMTSIQYQPGRKLPMGEVKQDRELDLLEIKMFQKFLTKKQINKYKRGEDVFISNDQLKEIAKLNIKK